MAVRELDTTLHFLIVDDDAESRTTVVEYLRFQIESGAQVVQVFDTWAGELSRADYESFALPVVQRIFDEIGFLPVMEREHFVHKHGAVWTHWADEQEHIIRFREIPELGLTQPGSRQLQFVMSPTQKCPRQPDNQTVRGTVRMKFGRRSVRIHLPETKVIFTR